MGGAAVQDCATADMSHLQPLYYSNQTLAPVGAAAVQDYAATQLLATSASDSRQTLGVDYVYSLQD